MKNEKIISCVLFTSGLDSTATAHYSKYNLGYETIGLTLKQGNQNKQEVDHAIRMARYLDIRHVIYDVSSYSDFIQHTVTNSCGYKEGNSKDIEINYIENRNAFFVLLGHSLVQRTMKMQNSKSGKVMLGLLTSDPNYPDSNQHFFQALSTALDIGVLNGNIRIEIPMYDYTKEEIYNYLLKHNIPIKYTWSCNESKKEACGECFGCNERMSLSERIGKKI